MGAGGLLNATTTGPFGTTGGDSGGDGGALARAEFAANAGLSIALALSITQELNWSVRMASQRETHMVAVERVQEYSAIEPERDVEAVEVGEAQKQGGTTKTSTGASAGWDSNFQRVGPLV